MWMADALDEDELFVTSVEFTGRWLSPGKPLIWPDGLVDTYLEADYEGFSPLKTYRQAMERVKNAMIESPNSYGFGTMLHVWCTRAELRSIREMCRICWQHSLDLGAGKPISV